jgi:putative membrane protein
MMWGNGGYGFGGFGGFGLGLLGMIIQLLIIVGVIYFVISLFQRNNAGSADDRADAILRERFVRGELSEDEYKRMRNALRK